ncbi:MAG UNVERIFIED_CONTAM: hypothetical protein LVR29_34520 [Microcystis novacekii LVE1205-3]|jgi:hypothetical protein
MVEMHHKVRTYKTDRYPLVELFRRGDLVDFSLGFFKFGIPPAYVSEVKKAIPNNGFHRFLIKGARAVVCKTSLQSTTLYQVVMRSLMA